MQRGSLRPLADSPTQVLRQLLNHTGWAVIHALPDALPDGSQPITFTVGLAARYSHPDLMLVGYPGSFSSRVLMAAVEWVASGTRFASWGASDALLQNFLVWFRAIDPVRCPVAGAQGFARQAYEEWVLGPDAGVLQVILPDSQGRYPWEFGCRAGPQLTGMHYKDTEIS